MAKLKIKNDGRNRLWSRNLQAMERSMPVVAEMMANHTAKQPLAPIPTRSGRPSLQIQTERSPIHLHSRYDPVAEADEWLDAVGSSNWKLGLVLGFGMGYHIEALVRRYPERRLVVLEPDADSFAQALRVRDLRAVLRHPNLRVMILHTMDARRVAAESFTFWQQNLDRDELGFLAWPVYKRQWPDFWREVQRHLGEHSRQELINLSTYKKFSIQWQTNSLTNLHKAILDPGVPALFETFKGKPAILVSAGPSLEKNIHLLHEAKDHALIVAVGSAIEALTRHNIQPDLLVSFDASADNFFPFARLDTRHIPLVYSSVMYPLVITEYQGPRFSMGIDVYPYERWLYANVGTDKGNVKSGPSTANLAWDLLRQMQCDPIVFIGQDLAFTDNKTHAAGVSAGYDVLDRVESAPAGYEIVKDIHGNAVLTTKVMLSMKIWFEQRMAHHRDRTYINATEGGARLEGTQNMTLRQVLDAYCQQPFYAHQQIMQIHKQEQDRLAQLHLEAGVQALFGRIQDDLAKVENHCQSALVPLQRLMQLNEAGKITQATHDMLMNDFARLDNQISSIESYQYFVKPALTHYTVAFDKLSSQLFTESDVTQKGQRMAELYAGFFGTVREVTGQIRQLVTQASENQSPYTRAILQTELDAVLALCDKLDIVAADLRGHLDAGTLEPIHLAGVANHFHWNDKELQHIEAYTGFIHNMLQRSSNFKLPISTADLGSLIQQIDATPEFIAKAEIMHTLYAKMSAALRAGVDRVRELGGIG